MPNPLTDDLSDSEKQRLAAVFARLTNVLGPVRHDMNDVLNGLQEWQRSEWQRNAWGQQMRQTRQPFW